jgi:hypothetical protein
VARLDALPANATPRAMALADLYRGVVLAESGVSQEEAAGAAFQRAIAGLRDASAHDRFRAHNNLANVLLARTEDRLFNHAFAMATGVSAIFYHALLSWDEARSHYQTAAELAEKLGTNERAAVQSNLRLRCVPIWSRRWRWGTCERLLANGGLSPADQRPAAISSSADDPPAGRGPQ